MTNLELGSWTEFKDLCITKKNLNCQYALLADRYDLYGPDANGLLWHTSILLTNTADVTDFEDNHKAAFNWAIGQRTYSFSTPDYVFDGDGVLGTCTAGQTLTLDYQIDGTAHPVGQNINGGIILVKDGNHGDYIVCSVVDADNLLPSPYTGATLSTWVKKWYTPEDGSVQLQTPYAGRIPAYMYLRVVYHSTGGTDVKVAMNYFLHTPN